MLNIVTVRNTQMISFYRSFHENTRYALPECCVGTICVVYCFFFVCFSV